MSSEDLSDRTLPPTARRRREALARGQVAHSAELTSVIILLAGCILIGYSMKGMTESMAMTIASQLSSPTTLAVTVDSASVLLQSVVTNSAAILWPFLLMVFVVSVLANLIQTGWLWIPPLAHARFRPAAVISGHRILAAFYRFLRVVILMTVAGSFWYADRGRISSPASGDSSSLLDNLLQPISQMCVPLSVCLILLAMIDYGIRYWQNERSLMMTVEEHRRELRDDAVSPAIKHRRSKET